MRVEIGDAVVDPMDGCLRKVVRIDGETLYLADGGVMGVDEVEEVWLESEIATFNQFVAIAAAAGRQL